MHEQILTWCIYLAPPDKNCTLSGYGIDLRHFRESPGALALISVSAPNHLLNSQPSDPFLQEQPNMISFNVAISACDSRLRINWSTSVSCPAEHVQCNENRRKRQERPITLT